MANRAAFSQLREFYTLAAMAHRFLPPWSVKELDARLLPTTAPASLLFLG